MTTVPRTSAVLLLLLATVLSGCGGDRDDRPGAAPASAAASPAESANVPPGDGVSAAPPQVSDAEVTPTGRPPVTTAPTERGTPSTPPFVLPTRSAGVPGARQVIDAFRAAGLPAPNARDRSVDCGPDGAGLGCAELVVTDTVAVYVFPDEANAASRADVWGQDASRHGTVVLSFLGTTTSRAQQQRYGAVLAGLG